MAQRLRPETADLQIILQHGQPLTEVAGPGLKEPPLITKARSPGQYRADVQPFAFDLPKHVLRADALRGARVMSAAGGMDMVVAAVKAKCCRVDPPLELQIQS